MTISNAVTIEWVNHASFILAHNGVRLMSDPWLWGSAFNNGWDLLCPTRFQIEDFQRITHLWFSHEHPDHFAPPVLKQIPVAVRRGITVLFQATQDQKVLNYCRGLEFQVQELPNHQWQELAPGWRIMVGKVPFFDSWLLIEAGGQRILNANDCVVDGAGIASEIAQQTGKVHLLLTQFSYANWDGNPDEVARRQANAREKLARVQLQIATFQPRQVIPFASFVYFSHSENFFNNDAINTVRTACDFIASATSATPVVLYPGNVWTVGSVHDNAPALAAYDQAYDLASKPLHQSQPVALAELTELAQRYIQRVRSQNSRLLLGLLALPPLRYFAPIRCYLSDLARVVRFDFQHGLQSVDAVDKEADVTLSSESLAFIFQHDWGFDTLTVNGRFQATQANYKKLVKTFFVGTLNNTGRALHPRSLLEPTFIKRALTKSAPAGVKP